MFIDVVEPINRELRGKKVFLVGSHKSQIALIRSICGWKRCLRARLYVVRWGRFQQVNREGRSHLLGLCRLGTVCAAVSTSYCVHGSSVGHSGSIRMQSQVLRAGNFGDQCQ